MTSLSLLSGKTVPMINVPLDIDFSTSPIHNNTGGKLDFHSRRPEKAISKFAGEFKTRAMLETTFFLLYILPDPLSSIIRRCHQNLVSSQNYRNQAQIFIKNELKFPDNYSI